MSKPDWSQVYLTADELKEKFSEAHLLTLKQHYYERCLAYAAGQNLDVKEVADSGVVFVQEHITLDRYGDIPLSICYDVETIDDDTMWLALDLLWLALQMDPDAFQQNYATIGSGKPKTFKYNELKFLVKH